MTETTYQFPDEPMRFMPMHLDGLLAFCVEHEASDITFQTNEPVFAEIYGRLYKLTKRKLGNAEVGDLLNAIYGPNGMAQILSGADVDTHYEFKPNRSSRFRFRVNGTGCQVEGQSGLQLTLRTIPTSPPHLAEMALPEPILNAYAPDDGVVYVTGSTGSGKSTLLAAIIREIAAMPDAHRKILTYESPIEFVYDSVEKASALISQSEIPRHLPSFVAGVRNALRRKPRLILVGEARDKETMSAVLEAAMTGHPVYTTLHSNGVAEVVRRLVATFPAEEREGRVIDILETVRLIIWQRLVPSLDGKRVPLREYLIFDEGVRDQLISTRLENITQTVRRLLHSQGQTMQVEAQQKFEAGIISERTYRVIERTSHSLDESS